MDFKYILAIVIGVVMMGVMLDFVYQTNQVYSSQEIGTSCTKNVNCQLGKDLLQSGTLVVGNGTGSKILTETVEWKANYTLGTVNISNMTGTQAFNFSYNYVNHNYLTKASDRNIAGIVGLAIVLGVLIMIFLPLMRKK
jgi:hypothetical protein